MRWEYWICVVLCRDAHCASVQKYFIGVNFTDAHRASRQNGINVN